MSDYLEPSLRQRVIEGRCQAWREAGEDRKERLPLLLLHGIGSNARAWAGQFAAFAPERRVIAWNAPGYAGSDPLPMEWPVPADYAAAALALIDALGIDRCILVGQSLGAIMATAMVQAAPERFAGLVLASPALGYAIAPGGNLPPTVAQRIVDVVELGPVGLAAARADRLLTAQAGDAARTIVHTAMAEVEPDGYAQAVRLLAGSDLPRMVAGLSLPALTMWGGADIITPPDACRRVAEALNGAHAEVPAVGHAFATEAPHHFNAILGSFVTDVERAKGLLHGFEA